MEISTPEKGADGFSYRVIQFTLQPEFDSSSSSEGKAIIARPMGAANSRYTP